MNDEILQLINKHVARLATCIGTECDINVARQVAMAFAKSIPEDTRNVDKYAALALILAFEADEFGLTINTDDRICRTIICGAVSLVAQQVEKISELSEISELH